jgi:Uma2 family endonuclease
MTAQLDKTAKRRVYARTGVKELWLVDPILLQVHLSISPAIPPKPSASSKTAKRSNPRCSPA